ncbi:MAG: cytochrome P450 [Pseudomonadota bacterium]
MPSITITDYKTADATLRRNDLRQAHYDEAAILMKDVLVNLHGAEHRLRRVVENKVFRRDFFRFYEQEVFPQTLAETLASFTAAGKADLVDLGYAVMLNLTADFSGVDRPLRTKEETETLLRLLRSFGKAPTLGSTSEDKAPIRREISEALEEFDTRFYAPSAERRRALLADVATGKASEDDLPRDVLTMLLQNEETAATPHDILMKEMAFFLLAGAFTSIHSMTHATHELFDWLERHPDEADRLRTDKLFIQRCAHESIRLHPSSPVARRRATAPATELPSGETVEPDDIIVIDLLTANKDKGVFDEDAAEFNPLRDGGKSPYGLSFGTGMHACIGRQLAAGVLPSEGTDPQTHQYGTIALILMALLDAHAQPDPDNPPQMDVKSGRPNWASYPVRFGKG